MTLTIAATDNQYSLRIPAHRFSQGGRQVYSFALDIATLDGLLPQRVEEEVVRDANRRLTPGHARKIQRYLADRPNWLLGALLLGIAPDALEFAPYLDENAVPSEKFGELKIKSGRANTMRIFDGQHRRRAIEDVIKELQGDERKVSQLADLMATSIPIVLYAEEDIKALRQMFVDASQTKPIERNTVTRFDEQDAFNRAAIWVAQNSDLFSGRVEMERTTVSRTSENIIAINQLGATLKTLDVGYSGRVSKERNDGHLWDLDALYDRCLNWTDGFMPAARAEYGDLMAGEIDNSEIPLRRSESFAYNATVVRIMAGCYYEWTKDGTDWEPLANFFRDASLQRRASGGTLLHDAEIIATADTVLASKPIVARAITKIVATAKAAYGNSPQLISVPRTD